MGYRDYSTAKGHIVDVLGHGDFTTIQAAINAASSGQDIFIRSGTYTEDLTLKAGVNISAYDGDSDTPTVTIVGKMTLTIGSVAIGSIRLQTNADFAVVISGTLPAKITFDDCYFDFTNHTGISVTNSNSLSGFSCYQCNGLLGMAGITWHDSTSPGSIGYINFFDQGAGETTTPSNNSDGNVNIFNSNFSNPFSTSGTGGLGILNTNIDTHIQNTTSLTFNGTGSTNVRHCTVSSGTATAITIGAGVTLGIIDAGIGTSNVNSISGLGTINYADLAFIDGTSSINVSTANALVWKPFATAGNTSTAVRGTAGFDSTQFTVTNGFVQISGGITVTWTDTSGIFTAASNNGYFLTAASTPTLPAAPAQGDAVKFDCDTGSTVTVTANAGQRIRIGSALSALAGTAVSNTQGNSLCLVYRAATTTWHSIGAPEGTWVVT